MEITSGGTGGPALDLLWAEIGNNVCGVLRGGADPEDVAHLFVGIDWRARQASWTAYEVENTWAQLEIDRDSEGVTLMSGVMDPERFEHLAGVLEELGLRYSLELMSEDNQLMRHLGN